MKRFLVALIGAMTFYALPASAQVGVELNAAHAEGLDGAELGIGYAIHLGPVSVTPSVGALIYKSDDDRYYMDNNGGNPRCRDSRNGRYADSWRCNNAAARAYGRLEAAFNTAAGFSIGAGARISNFSDEIDVTPYGTISFALTRKLRLKGNVGDGYYAGGLTLGF